MINHHAQGVEINEVLAAFGVATTQTQVEPNRRWEAICKVSAFLHSLQSLSPPVLADEPKIGDDFLTTDTSDLTKLAAECHRAKWKFDVERPSAVEARNLVNHAYNDFRRIGDMALKLRDAARSRSPAAKEGQE